MASRAAPVRGLNRAPARRGRLPGRETVRSCGSGRRPPESREGRAGRARRAQRSRGRGGGAAGDGRQDWRDGGAGSSAMCRSCRSCRSCSSTHGAFFNLQFWKRDVRCRDCVPTCAGEEGRVGAESGGGGVLGVRPRGASMTSNQGTVTVSRGPRGVEGLRPPGWEDVGCGPPSHPSCALATPQASSPSD